MTAPGTAPSPADLAAMEASLVAVGDHFEGLATELFEEFIAAHPQYASAFMNPEAARERMTRETLEAMLGLAGGESWVPVAVTNFVDLHRNYAAFTPQDYQAWFDLVIATMARRAGALWPAGARAAWERQAARIQWMVAEELACDWMHMEREPT